MYSMLKVAAVAALLLVAGIAIAPRQPSPFGAADPSASPTPSPIVLDPVGTPLEAGSTYLATADPALGLPAIVFTVPADGWIHFAGGNVGKNDHDPLITPWNVRSLFADPCHRLTGGEVEPPIGPSIDDLASGLVSQADGNAAGPTDVTLGGYPAKRLELWLAPDLNIANCEGGEFARWTEGDSTGGRLRPESRNIVHIVDVDGVRTLVDLVYSPATSATDLAEAQLVIDSIRFEPPPALGAAPSPSPAT